MKFKKLHFRNVTLVLVYIIVLTFTNVSISYSSDNHGSNRPQTQSDPQAINGKDTNPGNAENLLGHTANWLDFLVVFLSVVVGSLTIIILISNLFMLLLFWRHDKQKDYDAENFKNEINQFLNGLKENNQSSIENIKKKFYWDLKENFERSIKRDLNRQKSKIQENFDNLFSLAHSEMLDSIKSRQDIINTADVVFWQFWTNLNNKFSDALSNNDLNGYHIQLNIYHQFQHIVSSLLSSEQKVIADGLGALINKKIDLPLIPIEILSLIEQLDDQGRLTELYVRNLVDKLKKTLEALPKCS